MPSGMAFIVMCLDPQQGMLDLTWERTVPIWELDISGITAMMDRFDKSIHVMDFTALRIGCKNSNFAVSTNKGKFLLRITDKNGFNNECRVYDLVKGKIRVPTLLYHEDTDLVRFFVYQYIDGVSLQQRILSDHHCACSLLVQVAQAAALIHNTSQEDVSTLSELDVPPYEVWYRYFLENPTVMEKMGASRLKRTHRLVSDKQGMIPAIDGMQSLIHCDYRPANMLVDRQDQVFFVDWEGACRGHSLADIGQFFRYRQCFQEADRKVFEDAYNAWAARKLPEDWSELSRFRDLVNPLQLLSIRQGAPQRDADLLRIVEDTLQHWGY